MIAAALAFLAATSAAAGLVLIAPEPGGAGARGPARACCACSPRRAVASGGEEKVPMAAGPASRPGPPTSRPVSRQRAVQPGSVSGS